MSKYLDAAALRGKTLISIEIDRNSDEIRFSTSEGYCYLMYHSQDCCETVQIHDIVGDVNALLGSPLVIAKEETSDVWPNDVKGGEYNPDSFTWTTYVFETESATVKIRWLGLSNGYYSEDVQIKELNT